MSEAIIGIGTQLKIGDGEPVESFALIAEVLSITAFALSTESVSVTNMDSVDKFMEFIPGLRDSGEVSFDINYNFQETTHGEDGILKDFVGSETEKRNYQVVFPDIANTTWSFTGFLTGFTLNDPVESAITASITIKITGRPDFG